MRTIALFSLLLLACKAPPNAIGGGPSPSEAREVQKVTGAQAKQLVAQGAWLVDVRTADEFAEQHLEGARNIPLASLGAALATLPKDKPIIVYCAVGSRSAMAARSLAVSGFDVRNLGAMENWNQ